MKTAAFFDLDDTILRGNSGMRSTMHYFSTLKVPPWKGFKILYRYFAYFMGRSDARGFFRNIYDFLKDRDYSTEKARCEKFFERQLKKRIYREAVLRIKWHKKQGHYVAIVTNSLDMMVNKIKDHVKVDELIASRLEIKKGKITGKTSLISFGRNKVRFIKALAKKRKIDLNRSFAYSDNNTDIGMLAAVGNPIAINPKSKMRRAALTRNWQILRFNDIGGV